LTHSYRIEDCVYELRRRLVPVRHDVVIHHGRSCVPDAIPSQNADLAIASGRVVVATVTWAEPTNVEPSVQQNRALDKPTESPLEFCGSLSTLKRVHNIEPTNIQDVLLWFRQVVGTE
jgi:hypothetical protein